MCGLVLLWKSRATERTAKAKQSGVERSNGMA